MNGVVHVLDSSIALPHDQAFYDQEAAKEIRNLLTDNDHATSSDMSGMEMSHAGNSISVRVLAATNGFQNRKRLARLPAAIWLRTLM